MRIIFPLIAVILILSITESYAWFGMNLNLTEPQPVVVAQPAPVYVQAPPQVVYVAPQPGVGYYYPPNAVNVVVGQPGWFQGRYWDGHGWDKRYRDGKHWDGRRWVR